MEPDAQLGLLLCLVLVSGERYSEQIAKRCINELAVAYRCS